MNIEIKELENNQKALTVEIPEEIVIKKIDDAYRKINASTKLKGFRPGKIPKNLLRTYYWEKVKAQTINDLLPDYFQKAIDENKLQILGQPQFEGELEVKEKAPLSFKVIITTWPRIDLPEDYTKIEVAEEKTEVTEEHIQKALQELQNQHAKYQVVTDRPIKESDQVILNYKSSDIETGASIEEIKDAIIEVGSDKILPALSRNLLGMNKGEEKEFEETFAEDFANEKLAGKKIGFKILINEIKEKILPEIDEDFAKDLGDYTLPKIKEEIAQNIKKQFDEQAWTKKKNSLIDKLVAMTSIDPPEVMIKNELETMIHDIKIGLANQGKKLNESEASIKKLNTDLREGAIKKAKASLVLYEIACREGIKVTGEEIENQVQQVAMMYRQDVEQIRKSLKSELEKSLREQKTVDFLLKPKEQNPDKAENGQK